MKETSFNFNSNQLDKAQGCLIGQAIGDALGTTYEFSQREEAKKDLKSNFRLNGFLPIIGQGPFNLAPGQITDDTELALGLARSLVKNQKFDAEGIAQNYTKWFRSNPFDIGETTKRALDPNNQDDNNIKNASTPTYYTLIHNSRKWNQKSLSNGSLMRICPLGIWGSKMPKNLLEKLIKAEVIMTHPNPEAIDASTVFVLAIVDAILHKGKDTIYKNAIKNAKTDTIREILLDAETTPYPVITYKRKKTRIPNDTRFQGYLGVALQNMFYEFLHTDSFYQSLINIISRGGDTDTNSAIAGAFLGAYYGLSQIPSEWVSTVTECPMLRNPSEYPEGYTGDLLELAYKLLVI